MSTKFKFDDSFNIYRGSRVNLPQGDSLDEVLIELPEGFDSVTAHNDETADAPVECFKRVDNKFVVPKQFRYNRGKVVFTVSDSTGVNESFTAFVRLSDAELLNNEIFLISGNEFELVSSYKEKTFDGQALQINFFKPENILNAKLVVTNQGKEVCCKSFTKETQPYLDSLLERGEGALHWELEADKDNVEGFTMEEGEVYFIQVTTNEGYDNERTTSGFYRYEA